MQIEEATSRIGWWEICKNTYSDWQEDKAPRLGAALAYYTVFSLAPLLLIVLGIAGMVFGSEAVNGSMTHQIERLLGREGAEAVSDMVARARRPETSIPATIVGTLVLLFGASGVFTQLKDALNTIWEVEPQSGRGMWGMIKDRFASFAMVLTIGFLLLVSLALNAGLAAAQSWVGEIMPGPDVVAHLLNELVSLAVVALLFTLIFKYLPDAHIPWSDVWLGGMATAILFTVGKFALAWYLGRGAVASSYGAAGSVVLILLWTYYSSQILFLGAEFTQAYARARGRQILPRAGARAVTSEARAQQGISSPTI